MLLPLGIFHGMPPVTAHNLPWFEVLAVFFLSLLLLSCDEVANQLVRFGRQHLLLRHVFFLFFLTHALDGALLINHRCRRRTPLPCRLLSTHSFTREPQEDPFLNLPLFDLSDVSAGHMNRCVPRARARMLLLACLLRRNPRLRRVAKENRRQCE
jgi:hypothetical protein